MSSAYFGQHSHEGCYVVQQNASTYEEYLMIVARIQQFYFNQQVKNGFNEMFTEKISLEFPSKISLGKFDYAAPSVTDLKYQGIINIKFSTKQDYEPCRNSINPLTDPKQQLIYDGFQFNKYGLKKTAHQNTVYMKC